MLQGLRGAERAFGADVNGKGFKVLRGVGVIQVWLCGTGCCPVLRPAVLHPVVLRLAAGPRVALTWHSHTPWPSLHPPWPAGRRH